jgi:hypothetical protein
MVDEAEINAIVSDRIDRALSTLAEVLACSCVAIGLWMLRLAHASCPGTELCGASVVGVLFSATMSVAVAGVILLVRPTD